SDCSRKSRREESEPRARPSAAEPRDSTSAFVVGARLIAGQTESSLARLVRLDGGVELASIEIRPQPFGEIELGVRGFPEQEVGEAELAAGANHQIRRRQHGRAQMLLHGFLID